MKSLARASLVVLTSISLVLAFGATAAQAAATVGKPCGRAGMTTVDAQGRNLVCVKVKTGKDKGKLRWKLASTPPPTPTPSNAEPGAACSTSGQLAPMRGVGIAICTSGRWTYAFTQDLPASTAYTSRPSWYPTVDAVFGQPDATCAASTVKFTHTIIPLDTLTSSIPYGAMIGSHVTPIDHAYLGLKSLELTDAARQSAAFVPVTSPAAGTVIEVGTLPAEGSTTVNRVVINHGCGVYTVYMVLDRLDAGVQRGTKLAAGQQFGSQRDHPLDFNVFSGGTWLTGLANPLSYAYGEAWKPYTADPSPFFTPQLAAAYEAVMQRTAAPRWWKVDFDIRGAASGSWFLAGTAGYSGIPISSIKPYEWAQFGQVPGKNNYAYGHLALAPHWTTPSTWIASMGWFADAAGDADMRGGGQFALSLDGGLPSPDEVTAADGTVVYPLHSLESRTASGDPYQIDPSTKTPMPVGYQAVPGTSKQGTMAIRVNADGSLTVEVIANPTGSFSGFTSAARTYMR